MGTPFASRLHGLVTVSVTVVLYVFVLVGGLVIVTVTEPGTVDVLVRTVVVGMYETTACELSPYIHTAAPLTLLGGGAAVRRGLGHSLARAVDVGYSSPDGRGRGVAGRATVAAAVTAAVTTTTRASAVVTTARVAAAVVASGLTAIGTAAVVTTARVATAGTTTVVATAPGTLKVRLGDGETALQTLSVGEAGVRVAAVAAVVVVIVLVLLGLLGHGDGGRDGLGSLGGGGGGVDGRCVRHSLSSAPR